ncbi:MAG: GNAT family N-acetyltransferase [Candidatus Latescibacteria bacterium]|nr:GNAT family N-acetyltransferase [Candidatus Latescibacterota bacterium]
MCFLARPSAAYRDSFLSGAAEFYAEGRPDSTYAEFLGYDLVSLERHFADFVRDLLELDSDTSLPRGWQPDRVFWLIGQGEYLGQTSIRPQLSSRYLLTYGGHIGYSIRPSRRRQGYGTRILALALEQARLLGLQRVLVTCNSDNLPSKKIIEHNGGRFESSMVMPAHLLRAEGRPGKGRVDKLRYWIELVKESEALDRQTA